MDNQIDSHGKVEYIVSSCLIGLKVRYNGEDKLTPKVRALVEKGVAVPFCPEQDGGLPTPRTPAEIVGGDGHDVLAGGAKVLDANGVDVTAQFVKGAKEALELARIAGATKAVMKSLSPSCGVGAIYDGTFSGTIVEGDGVTTAILKEAGIEVVTEKEFEDD